jgi:hypothetical protein
MFKSSANICYESARECVRLARMSDDPELRYDLFQIARRWMAMALEEQDRDEQNDPAEVATA